MISAELLNDLLRNLGSLLEARRLAYTVVTIGGGSLLLLELNIRPTRDLDVIATVEDGRYVKAATLPEPLLEAARDVGVAAGVGSDWFNSGPASVLDLDLPAGFAERAEIRRYGSLTIHIAAKFDQICLKVHAAVDRAPVSKHLDDLRLLQPSPAELVEAGRWSMTHDPSEGYRMQLIALLRMFGVGNELDQL